MAAANRDISDYPDAVGRIVDSDVSEDSTTRDEVLADLRRSSTPQIDGKVARGVADAVITEDRVIDELEATGELPSRGTIESVTGALDDYDLGDRVDSVSAAVTDRVATVEDVDTAVRDRREQREGRPLFREHVEAAVDSVGEQKEFVGESADRVARERALDEGAPRERDFRDASREALVGESVTGADVIGRDEALEIEGVGESRADAPINVIRDDRGEPVALWGSQSRELGERVAEELGASYLSTEQIESSLTVEGEGERVDLKLLDRTVGEVRVR